MPDSSAVTRRFAFHAREAFHREIWPVPPVPFSANNQVDGHALDELIEFYIRANVDGLFILAYSGEAFELQDEERVAICRQVMARAKDRLKIFAAGNFDGDLSHQIDQLNRIASTGIDGVIVFLSTMPDAGRVVADLCTVARNVDAPLGVYECPVPEHRMLTPSGVATLAETGRFIFMKETSRDRAIYKAKLRAAEGSGLKLYQANWGRLPGSLDDGCPGFCGIIANIFPELVDKFCNDASLLPEQREALYVALTNILDKVVRRHYPASLKYVLGKRSLSIRTKSRMSGETNVDVEDVARLVEAYDALLRELPPRLLDFAGPQQAASARTPHELLRETKLDRDHVSPA